MIIGKILKSAGNEFIYGGHLQCLGIVAIVFISAFLLKIKITFEPLLIGYLIFYPIYINDRLVGIDADEMTNPERSKHFRKYVGLMPKIFIFSILLLAFVLIHLGNLKFTIFALLVVVLGILYPFYFKNITKRIIGFKNFYVSAFFTVMALVPVIYYSYPFNYSSLVILSILMALIFLKTLFMQILLDCKDVEGDKKERLLTFPILLGKENSFILLNTLAVLSVFIILIPSIFLLKVFPLSALWLFFTIPFNFYCVKLAKKEKYSSYIIASGEFVLCFILISIGNFIFTL